MVKSTLLFLPLLLPAFTDADAQSLRFARESIVIELHDVSYSLAGRYSFENASSIPIHTALFYPFSGPLNSVDSLHIINETIGTEVLYEKGRAGVTFAIEMPAFSSSVYRVTFLERTSNRQCEYILTSTAAWGRPLEHAVFTVRVPSSLHVRTWSFPPDEQVENNGQTVYHLERSQFFPDRNFVIGWEKAKP